MTRSEETIRFTKVQLNKSELGKLLLDHALQGLGQSTDPAFSSIVFQGINPDYPPEVEGVTIYLRMRNQPKNSGERGGST